MNLNAHQPSYTGSLSDVQRDLIPETPAQAEARLAKEIEWASTRKPRQKELGDLRSELQDLNEMIHHWTAVKTEATGLKDRLNMALADVQEMLADEEEDLGHDERASALEKVEQLEHKMGIQDSRLKTANAILKRYGQELKDFDRPLLDKLEKEQARQERVRGALRT